MMSNFKGGLCLYRLIGMHVKPAGGLTFICRGISKIGK